MGEFALNDRKKGAEPTNVLVLGFHKFAG